MIEIGRPPLRLAWLVLQTPCCGAEDVLFVVPADAVELECDCGVWLAVPRYRQRARGTDLLLLSEN